MSETCIFCKIASGEVKGEILEMDEEVVALRDIHPQAPVHVLVMPVKHIESVAALTEGDAHVLGRMALMAQRVARREGVAESGYRLVVNQGEHGGQTVAHLHMHLLGGRQLRGGMG
ncbi:MAG: histidine triad nucleotide-binding protein [Dehalococcoidia bacterium]|nr:histidine triad nucleotide-binding protein [Dehalococcoidia bacterium]